MKNKIRNRDDPTNQDQTVTLQLGSAKRRQTLTIIILPCDNSINWSEKT